MRIVIVGSGGTGGYFGARLAAAGEDVTFVARGAHLEAMREHGLTIRSAVDGEWRVAVDAVESLDGQEPADLVLICVKSFDTDAAAALVRPVLGEGTAVLSVQNGVDNEDKLADKLDTASVLGGVAYIFANIEAPGIIAHHQFGRIVFGELTGDSSERAKRIAAVFDKAGIDCEIADRIRDVLWRKYVFLVAFSGTTAVTRLPARYVREEPATRRLWDRQLEELLALADAQGINPGADTAESCNELLDSFAPDNSSSLYHDLAAGKRLELDALHGHAVRLGEQHGVATPTLFAVYAALKPYLDGTPV